MRKLLCKIGECLFSYSSSKRNIFYVIKVLQLILYFDIGEYIITTRIFFLNNRNLAEISEAELNTEL